jgi:hypothetical protein
MNAGRHSEIVAAIVWSASLFGAPTVGVTLISYRSLPFSSISQTPGTDLLMFSAALSFMSDNPFIFVGWR